VSEALGLDVAQVLGRVDVALAPSSGHHAHVGVCLAGRGEILLGFFALLSVRRGEGWAVSEEVLDVAWGSVRGAGEVG
jgi:hypothetical protein